VRGLAAAALALFALAPSALGEPIPAATPHEVLAQIAAAQVPDSPAKVVVGAYINDIQELDFKTNSYAVDLYVWFGWKAPDLDPSKTMEFMNRYDRTIMSGMSSMTSRSKCLTAVSMPSSAIRGGSRPSFSSPTIPSTRNS
jgi:hypothetical protein